MAAPNMTVAATPPFSPANGDLWYDDVNGFLFIWYVDADTGQWVVANPVGGPKGDKGDRGDPGVPGAPVATINVVQYGAKADDFTNNDAAFAAAIADAKAIGAKLITVPGGPLDYRIYSEIVIDFSDVTLVVEAGATIKQMTYGLAAIQVRGTPTSRTERVKICGGGRLYNPVPKIRIDGQYEGQPARGRAVGVYVYGCSYVTVCDLKIDYFVGGVKLRETQENALLTWSFFNRVERIDWTHLDFAVLANNQHHFSISDINGYWTDRSQGDAPDPDDPENNDPGPAPHMIYISGAATKNLRNQTLSISNCRDFFNQHSSTYKVKYTDGLIMENCHSQLCRRGFDINATQFRIVAPVARDLLGQQGMGFAALSTSPCHHGEVVSPLVYVNTDLSQYAALIAGLTFDTDNGRTVSVDPLVSDITFTNGKLSHNHITVANPSAVVEGTNIKFVDVEFEERGIGTSPIIFRGTSVNGQLIRPAVKQASASVRVAEVVTGALNTKISINPSVLSFVWVPSSVPDTGTGTTVKLLDGEITAQWTPVVTFDTPGDWAPTGVDNKGWYRISGQWIEIGFTTLFSANAYTTAAGDLRITGLPFPAVSPTAGSYNYTNGLGWFSNVTLTGTSANLSVLIGSPDQFLKIRRSQSANAGANLTTAAIPAGTASVRLMGTIRYKYL